MAALGGLLGAVAVAAGLLAFWRCRVVAQRQFGGLSGDLAGWFGAACGAVDAVGCRDGAAGGKDGAGMILLIGPLHGGKRDYACALLGCGRDELGRYACWDVQERAAGCENLEALARELSAWPVVIATETGGGVVPLDEGARRRGRRAGSCCVCWPGGLTGWYGCSMVCP